MDEPRQALPIVPFVVLPEIALCLLVAFYPQKTSWRFLALAGYTCATLKALSYTMGDKMQNYSIGCTLASHICIATYVLLLSNPLKDFRHTLDVGPPSELPLHKRLWWSFAVCHGPRGVGWNWQVANIPPAPTLSRRQFLYRNINRGIQYFLLVDLFQTYVLLNPLLSTSGAAARSINSTGYAMRCINIVMFFGAPYAMLNLQYCLLSTVAVASGISEPRFWPDLFGAWADAYTIRRFWGRTWHQMLRRLLASFGKTTARTLGFAPGSNASSYTQLYVAFIVSGLIHVGGDAMVGAWYIGASMPFFFVQAVAITVEDMVIALVGEKGKKSVPLPPVATRLVGYAWVVWWFSVSSPVYIDWSIEAGLSESGALPVSPVRYVLRVMGVDAGRLFR